MSDLFDAAVEYIDLGLSIIALTGKAPNGKVHRHGLNDALTEVDKYDSASAITYAFNHPDTTGIGILTTWPYIVVDIDGEEGAQAWKALVGDDEYMPDRWVAKTGRGLHLWYSTIEKCGSMKLGTKLDLKGDGGYVAAPPSLHPDGHRYEWLLPPGEPPFVAPDALLARISAHQSDLASVMIAKTMNRRVRHDGIEDGMIYASWGFDHLIKGMREEPVGNRNNYLHWAASVMAEEGGLDEEFEELRLAALDLGVSARRTIRSARRKHAG